MEAIIVIVGFLGAGKTYLLQKLVKDYMAQQWSPQIILNDYQNANLDAQRFLQYLDTNQVKALSGSCICCSGVAELRALVNEIPSRGKGVTLIEANGTTDACALMGFLGVGLADHFLPPIQISVVDARYWQKRGFNNELEANQIQVSSLIVLNHVEAVDAQRLASVTQAVSQLNPAATIVSMDEIDGEPLMRLHPSTNTATKMEHGKSHWSSCSVDLPDPLTSAQLEKIMQALPEDIFRVKGCTRLDADVQYSFFEKLPSGEVSVRPFLGELVTGPKLLTIGPGSDPEILRDLIKAS